MLHCNLNKNFLACAIQDCLSKNNYQEEACKTALANLEKCCKALISKGGKSACCPEKKYK